MPRKLRQLRADLRRAGFDLRRQVGSHQTWSHDRLPEVRVIVVGADGDDAKPYQEQDIREALDKLRLAEKG